MTEVNSLLRSTEEYKTLISEKAANKLSHAYLFINKDEKFLDDYLRNIAKIFVCENTEPCNTCRKCKLIDADSFSDVYFYPKDEAVKVEDVSSLIEESFIKPIEGDKKVFIISHAETMNAVAQNKLLKTLEEPPENVYILIGATSEFPIITTVKSRVKKFEFPPFTDDKLFDTLKGTCTDLERLNTAIAASDKTLGGALSYYNDANLASSMELCADVLVNMQSSKDLLKYSVKVSNLKCDLKEFLSVFSLSLRELLLFNEGKEDLVKSKELLNKIKSASGFNRGAILYGLEKTEEALERLNYNANPTMLIEWLLFQVLEGKYKWRKL